MIYEIDKIEKLSHDELVKLATLIIENMTDEEIQQLCKDFAT